MASTVIKLFLLTSSLMMGLVACHKPHFSQEKNIVLQEDAKMLVNPLHLRIAGDSLIFVVANNKEQLLKYDFNGHLLDSFSITDSTMFKKYIYKLLEHEPKRNYQIVFNKVEAKAKFYSNLFEIQSYYFDGRQFYFYVFFLAPYRGDYMGSKDVIVANRINALVITDINFKIKEIKRSRFAFKNINPLFLEFAVWKNTLFTYNYVILSQPKIDSFYPVFREISLADSFLSEKQSNFVKHIFFPKDSPISKMNNNIKAGGCLSLCGDHLYGGVNNRIYDIDNGHCVFVADSDVYVDDFQVLDDSSLYFFSIKKKPREYFLNVKQDDNRVITFKLNEQKVVDNVVENKKFYILTQDEENYTVKIFSYK